MIFIGIFNLGLGAIPLGSKTAFLDLAGSFIILSTTSYAIPIAAHLLNGRKTVRPGPFWMGKAGFVVQGLAVFFIILFNVFFCFRKSDILSRYTSDRPSRRPARHGVHNELQQRDFGRGRVPDGSLVGGSRHAKLRRPEDYASVHRRGFTVEAAAVRDEPYDIYTRSSDCCNVYLQILEFQRKMPSVNAEIAATSRNSAYKPKGNPKGKVAYRSVGRDSREALRQTRQLEKK
jgi:hypothetical protein